MFKRQILSKLHSWSQKPDRKPLVLRGARQVGKTTIVNEFGKNYEVYLKLNLEKEEHRKLFEADYPFGDLLMAIYLINNQVRSDKPTLLFIDEIQNSSQAVAMMRYFYEEAPSLHVIAAGSLLESLLDKHISFPVGRVEYLALRPCSFPEYLNALGESSLLQLIEEIAVPEIIHEKIVRLFNTYALIGGMPEIVASFAAHRDLVLLQDIYETLLVGYRDDSDKYARNNTMMLAMRHILHSGFAFASQRIRFERFANSGYRSREMSEALRTLEKAMLLELVYPVTGYAVPMVPDLKKAPRLLWLDTGLVNHATGIQKEIFGSTDISESWRGIVAEHIIGQELLAENPRVSANRSFWVREFKNSNAELDYLVTWENKLIPVEVKSGDTARMRSMHMFMDYAPHDFAIRFWSKPFKIDYVTTLSGKPFRLINLPFYFASQLEKIISKYF